MPVKGQFHKKFNEHKQKLKNSQILYFDKSDLKLVLQSAYKIKIISNVNNELSLNNQNIKQRSFYYNNPNSAESKPQKPEFYY